MVRTWTSPDHPQGARRKTACFCFDSLAVEPCSELPTVTMEGIRAKRHRCRLIVREQQRSHFLHAETRERAFDQPDRVRELSREPPADSAK